MAGYWSDLQGKHAGRRRFLQTAALGSAGLAALLVGCGGSGGTSGSPRSKSTSEEGPLAPSQVLKVRYYSDPQGFDPATLFQYHVENIAFNVYNGLTLTRSFPTLRKDG